MAPQAGGSLSKREKILVFAMVLIIEIFLLNKYLYKPALESKQIILDDKAKIDSVYNTLRIESARGDNNFALSSYYEQNKEDFQEIFDSHLSDESSLYFVYERLKDTNIILNSIDASDVDVLTTEEYVNEVYGMYDEGMLPKEIGMIENLYLNGYILRESVQVSLKGDQKEIIDFMKSIEENESLKTIDVLTMNKVEEEEAVYYEAFLKYTSYGYTSNIETLSPIATSDENELVKTDRDNLFGNDKIGFSKVEDSIVVSVDVFNRDSMPSYVISLDGYSEEKMFRSSEELELNVNVDGEYGSYSIDLITKNSNIKKTSMLINDVEEPIYLRITIHDALSDDFKANIKYNNGSDRILEVEKNGDDANEQIQITDLSNEDS